MMEIGGFMGAECNYGTEYHGSAIALNSGRNCLRYLIRYRNIRKIYIPRLLCSSVENVCREEGVEVLYYSIDLSYHICTLGEVDKETWLYLVNYYGMLPESYIAELSFQYEKIILDNVQAFFERPFSRIDTIYSCRKFFGVPDGGYLYLAENKEEAIEQSIDQVMFAADSVEFLYGRMEKTAAEYYQMYSQNEKKIESAPLAGMSRVTHNILRGIDYSRAKTARENNFVFLNRHLGHLNMLNVVEVTGPYAYPLLLQNGNDIKDKLIERKIYIPTLWKEVIDKADKNSVEYQMSRYTLPLPCDHRYGMQEMDYIIECILENI